MALLQSSGVIALLLGSAAWPAFAQTAPSTPTSSSTSSANVPAGAATQTGAGQTAPTAIDDSAPAAGGPVRDG